MSGNIQCQCCKLYTKKFLYDEDLQITTCELCGVNCKTIPCSDCIQYNKPCGWII